MKNVFNFADGNKNQLSLLGGKGANLAEMTSLQLPVPTGFTITTTACLNFLKQSAGISTALKVEIQEHIDFMEEKTGKQFGNQENPLLISVRSGSKFSMPGMMDTILNLGLNDDAVEGLVKRTGDGRFAYDCYRRLLQMFGDVVCGIEKERFEEQLTFFKEQKKYLSDTELSEADWRQLVKIYKDIYVEVMHEPFPQDPIEQLYRSVEAVFLSWNNRRAQTYRRLHGISDDLGTAVNIQEMVFGNAGFESGTGVAFTRNPATGEKKLFGEFLLNAQGEDVVAGVRTPQSIMELQKIMPEVYHEFETISHQLEKHYQEMQDIEFTIEKRKLYILQTRNGKRTAKAAFQIASDLVAENVITKQAAIQRIKPEMITQLLHPVFEAEHLKKAQKVAQGLPASPGAANGKIYFTAESAKRASEQGEKVILMRQETSPEDIEGMMVSEAIVTARGGMTSHAAVVARGMGVCCVAGCEALNVDEFLEQVTCGERILHAGDEISVDGSTGMIYVGTIPYVQGNEQKLLETFVMWAKENAALNVRANAETPNDIQTALKLGADGIGLARTEHMFFGEQRIVAMQKLILAEEKAALREPLDYLKTYQKADFKQIFTLVAEKPCTIRLLDPPLHEFLPKTTEEIAVLAEEIQQPAHQIAQRIAELHEVNPMLGHRGCRLGITTPEIYDMQVTAIIEAAIEVSKIKNNQKIVPEIMIPLVGSQEEMSWLKTQLSRTIQQVFSQQNYTLEYKLGTMLEIPRACLIADKIANYAEFFSFGTNDLTQLTYGFSRDDAQTYINDYLDKKILPIDPFQHIDRQGVGALMKVATEKIKAVDPTLKIGVCGEVGGDPASIEFLQELAIDYVSCSPYRIPAAILTIAQVAIKNQVTHPVKEVQLQK